MTNQGYYGWLRWGLASTHAIWGAALLLDPKISSQGRLEPFPLALLHILIFALMVSRGYRFGSALSFVLLFWYLLSIKPLAPIAEPQSVGLLAPSFLIGWIGVQSSGHSSLRIFINETLSPLIIRLGLAYSFVEWGLDALRNPLMFVNYFRNDPDALLMAEPVGLESATLILGVSELALAGFLVVGFLTRWMSLLSYVSLILFILVAGYPLAFPQNLALAGCSIYLLFAAGGRVSIDRLIKKPSLGPRFSSSA